MALFDRLAQRGTERLQRQIPEGKQASILGVPTSRPIETPQKIVSRPKTLSTTPTAQRINQLPQRGELGSTFQGGEVQKRFLADLPANQQLEGITQILAGQETNNQGLNDFVKTQAAQGKTPEQIRLAFVESQKASANPLVIL